MGAGKCCEKISRRTLIRDLGAKEKSELSGNPGKQVGQFLKHEMEHGLK